MDKRELLCDRGYEDSVCIDGYDEAIIGYTEEGRLIYDYYEMVKILQERDGMTEEEAIEWISYNTIRALDYYQNGPIIMYRIEEDMERAIKALERLQEKYDRNHDITDIDIAHVIEILKGRE